jgi:hypothetical protein
MRPKRVRAFQTANGLNRAHVHVRGFRSFNTQTPTCVEQGIHARHWILINRGDGYSYQERRAASPPEGRASAPGVL